MKSLGTTPPVKDKFLKMLRDKGLRATAQRVCVNSAMKALGHASADMVCSYLEQEGHNVTVASVYNILTQFAAFGIYGVRMSPENKMFFDYRTDDHLHMYDTKNGSFSDIEGKELLKELSARFRKFPVKGYKLDYVDVQLVCHSTRRKNTGD